MFKNGHSMKKMILMIVIFLPLLAPFACQKKYEIPSAPIPATTPTFTPTPLTTPVCGFTPFPNNAFALSPVPTLAVTTVITSYTPTITPSPVPTAVISYPNPPGVFSGPTTVLRTLAQFQAFFGNWVPPVDFNTQMVLEAALPVGCSVTDRITGVCEGPTQITVNLTQSSPNPYGPQCNEQGVGFFPIAVNQSDLPIVWQITEVVN